MILVDQIANGDAVLQTEGKARNRRAYGIELRLNISGDGENHENRRGAAVADPFPGSAGPASDRKIHVSGQYSG